MKERWIKDKESLSEMNQRARMSERVTIVEREWVVCARAMMVVCLREREREREVHLCESKQEF